MPKISVIVPVYNVEKYLHRCVDSILAQTFTDFELILVDDGSPDNCGTICDEYASLHNNVKVIHQKNQGLSAARNAGIDFVFENSDSNWLTFIDSDDWVHPQYLELLLKAAIENDVTISVCGFIKTFDEEPEIKNDGIEINVLSPEKLYVENNVIATIACAKLYKKECFKEIRYPVGKIHEDEFVTYRVLFPQKDISFINTPLYFYYQNVEGITGSQWNINRLMSLDAFEEQIHFFKTNGYIEALEFRIKDYFPFACIQIENLEKSNYKGKSEIKKCIIKRMRKLYRQNQGLPQYGKKHREWILAKIFPSTMRCYFILKRIIGKNVER